VPAAPAPTELRLRLVRDSDAPATNPEADPFEFGIQDAKQQVFAGVRDAGGRLTWEFTVTVKLGKDGAPNFTGPFASGPADDRFVYLSWRSIPRGVWINRIKARLTGIDWTLIERAQAGGRRLVADMSGWTPHDSRRQVDWRLE
jgi:hypothetical protein